jgi:hypothetical protein
VITFLRIGAGALIAWLLLDVVDLPLWLVLIALVPCWVTLMIVARCPPPIARVVRYRRLMRRVENMDDLSPAEYQVLIGDLLRFSEKLDLPEDHWIRGMAALRRAGDEASRPYG